MENINSTANNTNTTNEINTMMEHVRTIFDTTLVFMTEMKIGDRSPIKDIAVAVGTSINIPPQRVLPFVHYMCHSTSLGYVSAGKRGGFQRGERKLKTATPVKATETTTSEEDNTVSDE